MKQGLCGPKVASSSSPKETVVRRSASEGAVSVVAKDPDKDYGCNRRSWGVSEAGLPSRPGKLWVNEAGQSLA